MNINDTLQVLAAQKEKQTQNCIVLSKKKLLASIHASADDARDLSSRVFCLVSVPTNRLACPGLPSQKEKVQTIVASGRLQPIVADVNVKQVGSTAYTPKVVVVIGKESFDAAMTLGKTSVQVWASKQAAEILGCSCQKKKMDASGSFRHKDGHETDIGTILADYTAACKSGKHVPKMDAKGPEGWEGTIKEMKKHKEVDNPWALAHWMNDQGYEPHK